MCFTTFGGLFASERSFAQGAEAADPMRVLAPSTSASVTSTDPFVFRSRRARASLTSLADRDVLVIDLLDGVSFAALRTGRASEATWVGKTPEDPDGGVHLVLRNGVLVGSVRLHRALYRIRPTDDPNDALEEVVVEHVDESRFPACAVEQHQEIASAGHAPSSISPPLSPNGQVAATTATQIDVLVVYTPQARAAAGGQAAIEALIDLAVLESNTIYANSQASLELRLVHRAEVTHTESGNFTTELTRLQSPADGFLDTVHALRDTYGADVVSLIVNQSSSCGIGYVMTNATASFQGYAFNVVARSCATGYYSFAHELGHNFGCAHDRQTGGTGLFPYSHGYHNPAQTWRTVMAYPPGARIPYFSNPAVMYQGQPTGVSSTAPLGCDNAKTMSLSAPVTAAFRGTATGASEYGLGKLTSMGVRPRLSSTGSTSVASNSLTLRLTNAIPSSLGFVHVAPQSANAPFQGGTLYAAAPLVAWKSFRAALDGSTNVSVPLSASMIGQTKYYQAFFRDVLHPDGTRVGMSNGLQVTCAP